MVIQEIFRGEALVFTPHLLIQKPKNMNCSNCNHPIIEGKHAKCPECNFPTQTIRKSEQHHSRLIQCHNCGTNNLEEDAKCSNCNIYLKTANTETKKARTIHLDAFAPINGLSASLSHRPFLATQLSQS